MDKEQISTNADDAQVDAPLDAGAGAAHVDPEFEGYLAGIIEGVKAASPIVVATTKDKSNSTGTEVQRPGVVVSGRSHDEVFLSQCIYKNMYARKSLTVHHLQRRLGELGFRDALTEVDGWYGDLTCHAVQEFQRANKLDVTQDMTKETFFAIFDKDPHIIMVF
jgi:hypothetical protein